MDVEKMTNSKFYNFCDVVWRIIFLNMLTLITSLGIITIIPAFSACFNCFKDSQENKSDNLFIAYYKHFGRVFKESLVLSVISGIALLVSGYAIFWYMNALDSETQLVSETWKSTFYIGYYLTIFFVIIIVTLLMQMPMLLTYFNLGFIDNIKMSFLMTFKFFFSSILEIICWLGSVTIFFFVTPLWFFIGLSLPLFLIYYISKAGYWYILKHQDDLFLFENYDLNGDEDCEKH